MLFDATVCRLAPQTSYKQATDGQTNRNSQWSPKWWSSQRRDAILSTVVVRIVSSTYQLWGTNCPYTFETTFRFTVIQGTAVNCYLSVRCVVRPSVHLTSVVDSRAKGHGMPLKAALVIRDLRTSFRVKTTEARAKTHRNS